MLINEHLESSHWPSVDKTAGRMTLQDIRYSQDKGPKRAKFLETPDERPEKKKGVKGRCLNGGCGSGRRLSFLSGGPTLNHRTGKLSNSTSTSIFIIIIIGIFTIHHPATSSLINDLTSVSPEYYPIAVMMTCTLSFTELHCKSSVPHLSTREKQGVSGRRQDDKTTRRRDMGLLRTEIAANGPSIRHPARALSCSLGAE